MKTILLAASIITMATISFADGDPKYTNPEIVLADLKQVAANCAGMDEKGGVREEIFGIQMIRVGDTCMIVNGELDENVRMFLEKQNLPWAGVGLWIKATEPSD